MFTTHTSPLSLSLKSFSGRNEVEGTRKTEVRRADFPTAGVTGVTGYCRQQRGNSRLKDIGSQQRDLHFGARGPCVWGRGGREFLTSNTITARGSGRRWEEGERERERESVCPMLSRDESVPLMTYSIQYTV